MTGHDSATGGHARGRGAEAFLFGVRASGVPTHAASALVSVAALAVLAPARRAVTGDAMRALRHE